VFTVSNRYLTSSYPTTTYSIVTAPTTPVHVPKPLGTVVPTGVDFPEPTHERVYSLCCRLPPISIRQDTEHEEATRVFDVLH
jgi:hypothetical protein